MRWPVVVMVGYVLVGLQMGLVNEFLRLGHTNAVPSLIVPFVVFVALFAPPLPALWTALLLGLTIDLASPRGTGVIIAGPHALGFTLAAYLVITVRPIMMRRNPLTLMVLSIIASALAQLVVVAIFSFRGIYPDPFAWFPMRELIERLLSSLYTGATGLLLAFVLFPTMPMFGFNDAHLRRPLGRRP